MERYTRKKDSRKTIITVMMSVLAVFLIIVIVRGFGGDNPKKDTSEDMRSSTLGQNEIKSDNTTKDTTAKETTTKKKKETTTKKKNETTSKEDTTEGETPKETSDPKPQSYYDEQFQGDCFIGDSRTQALLNTSMITTADFLCSVGQNISDVRTDSNVITTLTNNKYRNIYIEFGVNELGWGSLDKFEEYYVEFVNHVKVLQPDAHIYVQSIIPVTQTKSDSNQVYTLENVERFNERVISAAKKTKVTYLDIVKGICGKNRVLPEESSRDGVHMGKAYNDLWLDYIISERK